MATSAAAAANVNLTGPTLNKINRVLDIILHVPK